MKHHLTGILASAALLALPALASAKGKDEQVGNNLTYRLAVAKNGSGKGTVSADGGAIKCGTRCSDSYPNGTQLNLSAVADSGSEFAGWEGCEASDDNSCTLTVGKPLMKVTATFNLKTAAAAKLKKKIQNLSEVLENGSDTEDEIDPDSGDIKVLPNNTSGLNFRADAPDDVGVRLPRGIVVKINRNGDAVDVTDLDGTAQFVTRKVGSSTQLEIASGRARYETTDKTTAIPLNNVANQKTNILKTTSGSASSIVVRRDDKGGDAFIEKGSAVYQSIAAATGSASGNSQVFAGETASFSNAGTLQGIKLGSPDGDQKLPGDPLLLGVNAEAGLVVPQLQGSVARLQGTTLLQMIQNKLDTLLAASGSTIAFNSSTGVIAYRAAGSTRYYLPLGSIQIATQGFARSRQANRFGASNPTETASGTFALVDRGVQLTLSSTLGYFTDMDSAIKSIDPVGKLTLLKSGVLQLTILSQAYATQPGALAATSGQAGTPGFEPDSSGYLIFRDSIGGRQTLYPTFYSLEQLHQLLLQIDPAADVSYGSSPDQATATLQGSTLTFQPQYPLPQVAPEHTQSGWWADSSLLFYNLGNGLSQAFSVR